jgi:hypothetical protein
MRAKAGKVVQRAVITGEAGARPARQLSLDGQVLLDGYQLTAENMRVAMLQITRTGPGNFDVRFVNEKLDTLASADLGADIAVGETITVARLDHLLFFQFGL